MALGASLPQRIFEWAAKTPDKPALIFDGQRVSYRALASLIGLARGYFARRGAAGGGAAILATRHSIDFWVSSLALRSLGVTTMAVGDTETVANAGLPDVRFVVTSRIESWPGLKELCAARGWTLFAPSVDGEAPLEFDPGAAVRSGGQVLRTSGTTGAFKKVLMDVSFEESLLLARNESKGLLHDSVHIAFRFPPWSGVGYKDPAAAWLVGATVLFYQDKQPHPALSFPGVTHAVMAPPTLAAVLSAPNGAFPRNGGLHLTLAAGSITASQLAETKARITPNVFCRINATEAARYAYTPLETAEDQRWHRPAPGAFVQIVDEDDRPTPLGEVGRVRVSTTDGPAGYLNDEEATRAFFKDGFFYPGDLAVMREDGRFALFGRATDVINVRGFKISPAPVETAIAQALSVSACLFSLQDETGFEDLHVIIESANAISLEALAEVLEREAGGPPRAHIHYLPALPRDSNGKLQRRAAKEAAIAAWGDATPASVLELKLARPSPPPLLRPQSGPRSAQ